MPTNAPRAILVDHVMNFSVPAVDVDRFPRLLGDGPQASRTGDLNTLRIARSSDVGPVPRQVLTRAEGLFGGLFSLTLGDELTRRQVPE